MITVRRLLKSWATPPARRPTASIFCDCRNRSSSATRSVMSRIPLEISVPCSVSSGLKLTSMGNSVPSLRRPCNCILTPISRTRGSLLKSMRCPGCFPRNRSGINISICRFSSSSRWWPNNLSACALTRTIRPSLSTTTIASGAASSSPRNFASARLRSVTSCTSEATPSTRPDSFSAACCTTRTKWSRPSLVVLSLLACAGCALLLEKFLPDLIHLLAEGGCTMKCHGGQWLRRANIRRYAPPRDSRPHAELEDPIPRPPAAYARSECAVFAATGGFPLPLVYGP